MELLWSHFLKQNFPIDQISSMYVYTDNASYWLTRELIDAAQAHNCTVSQTMLDELVDEDMFDIHQSFTLMDEDVLLIGIFSENNTSIDLLNQLFPPLTSPKGYSGFSMVTLQKFPNTYLGEFLNQDFSQVKTQAAEYFSSFENHPQFTLDTPSGTNLSFQLSSKPKQFPFTTSQNNRHILFPSYEIVSEIKPSSVQGKLIIDNCISEFYQDDELIDPMGPIDAPISLDIEDGIIKSTSGSGHLYRRFNAILEDHDHIGLLFSKIGLGVAQITKSTGIFEVEKQRFDTINFGILDRSIEFVINQPRIVPKY